MKATGRRYKPPSTGRWDVAREGCLKKARSELERRIALIHAPSGYGKTTLAAQICADDSRPAAWLTLRHTDNNPRLLLERLFCALAEVEQFSLKNRVTEWSRSLSESSGFLDALHDRRPTQLVLDDFQVLRNDIAVNVIRALTSEWPTGSRLILISQTEPEISKSRIRVSHDLTEITHADLAFSLRETTQVLKSGDPGWTDSEIAELQSLTEGWPAGVALADVAHFDSEDASAPLVQPEGLREVAEYFLDEVLGKQTPECREFMLSISVVDRFSAPLCNAMTGRRDAAGLIEHLRRENAFLVPLDREGHWYRFHRLLRETLRTELERRHPRDGRTRLLRASTWHENEGSPEEAFEYARRIGHFDRAGFTLLRHWEEFARRGQIETVRRWLERCSEAQIESDPKMAIAAGWIAGYGGETLRIRRYLRAAEKCDLDMPSPDGASTLRASMMSLRSTVGLD